MTRHAWVKVFIRNFEHSPQTQMRVHLFFTYFWLLLMLLTPLFIRPHLKDDWIALAILEVSLYANFATDYGAISAAEAAAAYPPHIDL